jgi:hypothetical protein
VRFEEEMVLSWNCFYTPSDGRQPAYYEHTLKADDIPSRWVVASWEQYLLDCAETKRQKEEQARQQGLACEAAKRMAQEAIELLAELGYNIEGSDSTIEINGGDGITLSLTHDLAQVLFSLSGSPPADQQVEKIKKLMEGFGFAPDDQGYVYLDQWGPEPHVTVVLPLSVGGVVLEHLRRQHGKQSDRGGEVVESLLGSLS